MAAKSIVQLLFLAVTINLVACNPPTNTIINGHFVESISEFPYHVLVRHTKGSCGGAIISDRHVLTAGHCVNGRLEPMPVVFTGSLRKQQGERHDVKRFWINQDYQKSDIAVLELEDRIEFNSQQNKIALPTSAPYAGELLTISGFGKDEYAQYQTQLKFVYVPVIGWGECKDIYWQYGVDADYEEDKFCTRNGGKGVWKGDSGGPLVHDGKLVGIASKFMAKVYDRQSRDPTPDIHVNVFLFVEWIKQCMDADSYPSLKRTAIYPGGYSPPSRAAHPSGQKYYIPGVGWVKKVGRR